MYALELTKVSKKFNLTQRNLLSRASEKVAALQDISLKVKKGECLGIIGRNGSGKTTLLKIITGVLKQDSGKIKVNGNLMSFIDLNAGVNPELTGKENIFLYGSLLGMSNKEIKKKYDGIVDYAQIQKRFLNTKFKNYSSGMKVRLTFSIAMANNPDILLIDEAIAVGDEAFQKKSFNKIKDMKRKGKTILIVSHSLSQLNSICDSVILLEEGRVIKEGKPNEVVNYYLENIYDKDAQLLIKSIEKNKKELGKLNKEKKPGFFNRFFSIGNNLEVKRNEAKKDLIDKLDQVIEIFIEKNSCLHNLETEYSDKKAQTLIRQRLENNFRILEFLFLKIKCSNKSEIEDRTLNKFEIAFNGLFELANKSKEIKKVIAYFIKFHGLLENLGKIKQKSKLIYSFSHFIYAKNGLIKDNSFKKINGPLIDKIVKKSKFRQNLTIQEYEGYIRKRFEVSEDEDERKHIISEFFDVCINNLEEIKDRDEKYLFFKNTILGMLNTIASNIKDVSFKISVAENLGHVFNREIKNKFNKEKKQKMLDILGSFLRNELVDLDDVYLQLNLKKEKNRKEKAKNSALKKDIAKIKNLKDRIYKDLVELYERDPYIEKTKWGFGDIIIEKVEFYNSKNKISNVFNTNEKFLVRIFYSAKKKAKKPRFGIAIHTDQGVYISGNNFLYKKNQGVLPIKGYIDYKIDSLPLRRGNFLLSVSVYDTLRNIPQDHHYKAYLFKVTEKIEAQQEPGLIDMKARWEIK